MDPHIVMGCNARPSSQGKLHIATKLCETWRWCN